MRKPWTTREQKDCAAVYSTHGIEAAMTTTGRSRSSIISKMSTLGCNCPINKGHRTRQYYAEDIASIFEMISCGLTQALIAEYYNTTRAAIKSLVFSAKQSGFDAYPLRNK
jgi:Zn ribbon nucleic-acid-binding protein